MAELHRILPVKRKETYVEFFFEFVVAFSIATPIGAMRPDEEDAIPFPLFLLQAFLPVPRANNAYVKFWSHRIAALLEKLPDERGSPIENYVIITRATIK